MSVNKTNTNPIEECFIEDANQEFKLTIRKKDKTGISALLREKSNEKYHFNDKILSEVKNLVTILDDKLVGFANEYVKYRNEYEFLYDIVGLSKYISELPSEARYLVKEIGNSNDLFHNRIVAQLLEYYQRLSFKINPIPVNRVSDKKHDFNVEHVRCEVKTIRDVGKLESLQTGITFSSKYADKIIEKIHDDISDAKEQVNSSGLVFISPWSYKINSFLQNCFSQKLSNIPPKPKENRVVLELTSQSAFQDSYASFMMDNADSEIETEIRSANKIGLQQIHIMPIRKGMITQYFASQPGTSTGFFFRL